MTGAVALRYAPLGGGSADHYYHYLWGYLFPGLDRLIRAGHAGPVYIRSCGPVMDARTRDAGRAFGVDFRIVDHLPEVETWTLPRLDLRIMAAARGRLDDPGNPLRATLNAAALAADPDAARQMNDPDAIAALPGVLRAVRDRLRPRLVEDAGAAPSPPHIILDRSPPHPHYPKGGPEAAPDYGRTRRHLQGIDPALRGLRALGYDVGAVDCGAHGLADQAAIFAHSRGIAMIRGAEVANLIWCAPGTPVMILEPDVMLAAPPHVMLAAAAGLDLHVIRVPTRHPVLEARQVHRVWARRGRGGWGDRIRAWSAAAKGRSDPRT